MAVKRYFTNDTAAISLPSPTGSWDVNSATGVSALGSTGGAGAGAASQAAETSTTNPTTSLARRFVDSTQVVTAGTLSGSWSAVIAANESNAAADAFHRIVIKVVSSDGTTTRGSQAFVHGSELTTTNTAYTFSGSLTGISCSVGDRIVVEVGGHFTNTVNTNYQVNIRRGGTAGDLVAGDTGTNANDRTGHITFSDASADALFASGTTGALAGSSPKPTGELAGAVTAPLIEVVTTAYTDTSTGGAQVDAAVTGVLVRDALLIVAANAYTDPADAVPTVDLGGSLVYVGLTSAWIGDPEAPTYYNQNLGTWLWTASAAGTANVALTESNENVLAVLHLRPTTSGHVVVVNASGVAEHLVTQSGGGPAAAQAIGAVAGVTAGLLVGAWAGIRFGANSWTPPGTMTERADLADGANTQTLMVATELLTATASTGTRTATAANAPANGFAGKLISLTTQSAGTTGALAGSSAPPTGALTGAHVDSGAVAGSTSRPTGALTGTHTATGAVAGSTSQPTGALTGTHTATGALAGAPNRPTGALAGSHVDSGALAGSTSQPTGALTGTVQSLVADGVLAGTAPRATGALAGTHVDPGVLAGSSAQPTGALAGTTRAVGALAGATPRPLGNLTGSAASGVVRPIRAGTAGVAIGGGLAAGGAAAVLDVGPGTGEAVAVSAAGPRAGSVSVVIE